MKPMDNSINERLNCKKQIYIFSDNMLNDSIVLDPQWLIDAFKSLITAKMFCCRKPEVLKKWIQFDQSAILTRELVGKKSHVLFISKIQRYF